MIERLETSAALQETLVQELSSKVENLARVVFADAEVTRWDQLLPYRIGRVIIAGRELIYRLEGQNYEGGKVASFSLAEDLGKSAKITGISLLVKPTLKVIRDESLVGKLFGITEHVEEITLNFEEGASFDYRAGTKVKGTALTNELIIFNRSGQLTLERIFQYGLLTNPELKGPHFYGGITGDVKDGKFVFVIVVAAEDHVKGENVRAAVSREFTQPSDSDQKVYVGETLESRIVMDLPKPFRVNPEVTEQTKSQKGRALAGRINRYLPNQFTEQQVRQMFGNILEGTIFCAGVWNPLEVTGARRVSKKQAKEIFPKGKIRG